MSEVGWLAIERFIKSDVWRAMEETLKQWRTNARDVMCDAELEQEWRHMQGVVGILDRVLVLPQTMLEEAKTAVEEKEDGR